MTRKWTRLQIAPSTNTCWCSARQGPDAWDRLACRWTPRLLRYARRVLGGSSEAVEAARDVVQETWIGAIRGLGGLRDPAQFQAYGIATRKCADAIRANRRRRSLAATDSAACVADRETELDPDRRMDLAMAIRRLPPMHRAVVHLFYREDLSVEEIAVVLDVPAGIVKSRLHHGRRCDSNWGCHERTRLSHSSVVVR
jgi:RNA polymerase sigma-70 factor, ECF subfamily